MIKRIVLVTGGMGGIGHATCKILHNQGFQVVAGYNRPHQAALAWQEEQKKAGYLFDISYVDVANFDACLELVQKVESLIGPIDILINNAGITRDHACCKMSKDDWDKVISVDLNSVFYMTRALINRMKEIMDALLIFRLLMDKKVSMVKSIIQRQKQAYMVSPKPSL
jgi:acetoacetyl-CoA reductase